eukprot:gene19782-biopygen31779
MGHSPRRVSRGRGFVVVALAGWGKVACPNEYQDQLHAIAGSKADPYLHPALAHVDWSKAGLIGHSMGGFSTSMAAATTAHVTGRDTKECAIEFPPPFMNGHRKSRKATLEKCKGKLRCKRCGEEKAATLFAPSWLVPEEGVIIRTLQLPVGPDYAQTSHTWQGETCPLDPGLLADLNFLSGADLTAGYIVLSRVRALVGLRLLRDFNPAMLHRHATKANVDILLQRLRGTLTPHEEGSKRCTRCKEMKVRSAFVHATTGKTTQWESADRKCLPCVQAAAEERIASSYTWRCIGPCHRLLPRRLFGASQREKGRGNAKCRECSGRALTRRCHGLCGRVLQQRMFSGLQQSVEKPVCMECNRSRL